MSEDLREASAKLPILLEEVALVDVKTCAAVGQMSVSWWHAEVTAGRAPQPVIREVRCVRWKLSDVRAFWLERGLKGSDPAIAERIKAQAIRASGIASRQLREAAEASAP